MATGDNNNNESIAHTVAYLMRRQVGLQDWEQAAGGGEEEVPESGRRHMQSISLKVRGQTGVSINAPPFTPGLSGLRENSATSFCV